MKEVIDYLHHRKPYLFIDEIIEAHEKKIICSKNMSINEFFFQGHFPGAPIVPGSIMHEMTTQAAGIMIAMFYNPMKDYNTHDPFHNPMALGVLHKTKFAKYKGFAKPNDNLVVEINLLAREENYFNFKGNIKVNNEIIMKNEFTLCNIESKLLYS